MAESTLVLRPGKERSLVRRHPWIYSGAVERMRGACAPGDVVVVRDSTGRVLGRAGYNAASQIVGRMWTFDDSGVDDAFVAKRIEASVARRRSLDDVTNAARLVYSESDGVPGLIVDRYDDVVVLQFTAATAERWRRVIVDVCASLDGVNSVFDRSDLDVRRLEGLSPTSGLLAGAEPPPYVEIHERGCRYLVDVRRGHKTGFYLDQRDNRSLVAGSAAGRRVLNLFCYTGAFSIAAIRGGATSVVSVDSSAQALEIARNNADLNGVTAMEWVKADVFAYLRELRDAETTFDLIVLDPPKLAASAAQVRRAAGVQGFELARIPFARAGRFPGNVLVLRRRRFRVVHQGRRRGSARCAARGRSRGAPRPSERPSGVALVPRKRLPQGFVVPG